MKPTYLMLVTMMAIFGSLQSKATTTDQPLPEDSVTTVNNMLQARKNFIQGNLDAAREYALKAQAQGNEEATTMLGQIDYKVLQNAVENGTATESLFIYFKKKYKDTEFERQADALYNDWKTPNSYQDESSYTTRETSSGYSSDNYTQRQAYSSSYSTQGKMHFDREAYEKKHFGPAIRVGVSSDIAFGVNAIYGGGLSLLFGRANKPINLLVGAEFNVLGHFDSNHVEDRYGNVVDYKEYYDDHYVSDNNPFVRARRWNIPIEIQFNLKHNDNQQRLYLGIGADYSYNFYGKLIDKRIHTTTDYKDFIKKHTFDVRASLGYSWRHVDFYCFMKVLVSNPFSNNLWYWEENNDGVKSECRLEDYSDYFYGETTTYRQLNRRCSGGIGLRLWF